MSCDDRDLGPSDDDLLFWAEANAAHDGAVGDLDDERELALAVPDPDCGHRRGAIDLDTGAWHCHDCGGDVFDDEPSAEPYACQDPA